MYVTNDLRTIQMRMFRMAVLIRDILEKNDIPYFITYGTLLGAVRHKGFIPWDGDFDFYLFDETYEKALECIRKDIPSDMFVEYYDTEPLFFHGWAHIKDLNSEWIWEGERNQDAAYAHQGVSIDLYRTRRIPENHEKLYRATQCVAYLERRKKANLISDEEYVNRMTLEKKIIEEEKNAIAKVKHPEIIPDIYAFEIFYDDRLYVDEVFPLKKYLFEGEYFYGPNKPEALLARCYGDFMTPPPVEKRHPRNLSIKVYEKGDENYIV